jgi:hypothetical protein
MTRGGGEGGGREREERGGGIDLIHALTWQSLRYPLQGRVHDVELVSPWGVSFDRSLANLYSQTSILMWRDTSSLMGVSLGSKKREL